MSPEERFLRLSQREADMRDFVNNEESILKGLEGTQRRSVQIALLKTKASLLAYQQAQITSEDPRITDQDFNVFKETIIGESPVKTFELLKDSANRALRSFTANINSVNRSRNNIPTASLTEATKQYVENAFTYGKNDELNPDNIRARLDEAFNNYAPKPENTAQSAIIAGEGADDRAYAQAVLINPKTGQSTTSSDPDAVTMTGLFKNGKLLTLKDGTPVVVKDATSDDLAAIYTRLKDQLAP
jgi:hypothetical protein